MNMGLHSDLSFFRGDKSNFFEGKCLIFLKISRLFHIMRIDKVGSYLTIVTAYAQRHSKIYSGKLIQSFVPAEEKSVGGEQRVD